MSEKEIYNYLKNISLIDIINIISKQNNENEIINTSKIDIYYTAKDLYRLYPNVFSKYKLGKFIKEENLPVIKNGKERLFLKSNIEEWLKKKNDSFFYKIN